MKKKKLPLVLIIAGSDPSGGAGIEADIKTLSALKVYALDIVTSYTVQNTTGVYEKFYPSGYLIKKQLEKIFEDIEVNVIKIGMTGNKEIINIISTFFSGKIIVFDPVIYSKNGFLLMDQCDIELVKEKILPYTTIMTPNFLELKSLCKIEIDNPLKMAENILNEFTNLKAILIKGGHINEDKKIITDILMLKENSRIKLYKFKHKRINSKNLHGTGCTLSSAIAGNLAKGYSIKKSVKKSIWYLAKIIKNSANYRIGNGNGPLIHFL